MIAHLENVDGWTVEESPGKIDLLVSNRYGESVTYEFDAEEALKLGRTLVRHSKSALSEGEPDDG